MNKLAMSAALVLMAIAPSVHAETGKGASVESSGQTIGTIAAKLFDSSQSESAKVRAAMNWTHANMDWTGTDYQKRTVQEILQRGGGNCFDQANVIAALLETQGIRHRRMREINIQPASDQRQNDAEAQILRSGNRASVFGRQHNDHVWIEFYDASENVWIPADPTLNVMGVDEWVAARMGFANRPVHDVVPFADMLVPIAVLAEGDAGDFHLESERFLIEGFARTFPAVAASPHWADWKAQIIAIAPRAEAAFEGTHNLHEDAADIDRLLETYRLLRADVSGA